MYESERDMEKFTLIAVKPLTISSKVLQLNWKIINCFEIVIYLNLQEAEAEGPDYAWYRDVLDNMRAASPLSQKLALKSVCA